jgi:hypothetical protein
MSNESDVVKPSHIAAARLKVAIADRKGENVAAWIRELASRDMPSSKARPRQDGSSAVSAASSPPQPPDVPRSNIDSPNVWVHLAQLFERQGDMRGARLAYQQAADAGDIDALVHVGNIFRDQGSPERARPFYQRAADAGITRALVQGHGKVVN